MPDENDGGLRRIYLIVGITCLVLFVFLTIVAGGSLLLVVAEIFGTLMTVFLIYGVVTSGIERHFSEDEVEDIRFERGSVRESVSHKIKRFRDKHFYKFKERD